MLDKLYGFYSDAAIPALGKVVAGDGAPYRYLVESIRKFPAPEVFAVDDRGRGFRAGELHAAQRRHRRDPLGLEALTARC